MDTKTLEKLQRIYDQADSFGKSLMEKEFSELKSEDNIFKELLHNLIVSNGCTPSSKEIFSIYDKTKEDCLAWLEKQGEQTTTDEFKPKFKVGDWIVEPRKDEPDYLWHIDKIEDDTYWYDAVNAGVKVAHADKNYHLWTIQDVKDGDILEFADHGRIVIGIVSHVNKVTYKVDVNCLLEGNNFKLGNYYALDTIKPHPATKEQCNLLFQKIEEAGYEWDSEKRELKEIELPNGEDYGIDSLYHAARILEKTLGEVDGYQSDDGILEHKCAIEAVKRLYKQKLAWSKEDEEMFNETLYFINEYQKSDKCKDENGMQNSTSCEKWLHSIKNRLTYGQEEEMLQV